MLLYSFCEPSSRIASQQSGSSVCRWSAARRSTPLHPFYHVRRTKPVLCTRPMVAGDTVRWWRRGVSLRVFVVRSDAGRGSSQHERYDAECAAHTDPLVDHISCNFDIIRGVQGTETYIGLSTDENDLKLAICFRNVTQHANSTPLSLSSLSFNTVTFSYFATDCYISDCCTEPYANVFASVRPFVRWQDYAKSFQANYTKPCRIVDYC